MQKLFSKDFERGKEDCKFQHDESHLSAENSSPSDEVLKEYEAAAAASSAKAKTATRSVEVPIQQAFEKCKNFSRDSGKAKAINEQVMEFIAPDDQPFSVVENTGFRNLIAYFGATIPPPKPPLLLGCVPPCPVRCRCHTHPQLDKNGLDVSFTTDIWTSDVSPVSMLSLTAQWLDEDFNMQKAMLHAQECPGSHTVTMICQAFETII